MTPEAMLHTPWRRSVREITSNKIIADVIALCADYDVFDILDIAIVARYGEISDIRRRARGILKTLTKGQWDGKRLMGGDEGAAGSAESEAGDGDNGGDCDLDGISDVGSGDHGSDRRD